MKLKLLLLACATFLFVHASSASHVVGMNITYRYDSTGNDYIFRLTMYRDCSGITAPLSVSVLFASSCAASFSVLLPLIDSGQVSVNSCAGFGPTSCQGGVLFGYQEYVYEGPVSVAPCADWIVSSTICCRNAAITNVVNPDFYSTYVETTFDNLNFPGNSSPEFGGIPMNYYCVGIPALKDFSAFDGDGDSLRYELVAPQGAAGVLLPMPPGYGPIQPLAVFTPAMLDSLTGLFLFNPSMVQVATVAVMVSEYRNGTLIGRVRLDDEIVVASGIANPDTVTGRVYIDFNSNSTFDAGDQAMPNVVVSMNPGNQGAVTAGNGKYEFFTIDGTWDITVPNPPPYATVTPASIQVNSNGITSSSGNDFILNLTPNINDLEVYLNYLHNPVSGQPYPLNILYKNSGTTVPSNATITLTLDPLLHFVSSTPTPTSAIGNTITWTIPSIPVYSAGDISIITSVDTTALMNMPVLCTADILPIAGDLTPVNNSDNTEDLVATSCDPNFKEVIPEGDLPLSFITSQDWLTYRIHFQNLGNAPAQEVRILDLLDPDLEFVSVEYIASSFPCSMNLTGPNKLEFRFFGINLPAASVDEPGSHGFVEFRIRPKATLVPGSHITNNAGIYFDFNAPVYTNLVHNTVVQSLGVAESAEKGNNVRVYPNPVSGQCVVELYCTAPHTAEIALYDLLGLRVKHIAASLLPGVNSIPLDVSDLASGYYLLRTTGAGETTTVRLGVVGP
jgi:uncharacterized repeat protein (TIGR01451 family)